MPGTLERLKKWINGEWQYKGLTNRYMGKRTWTNGSKTLHIYWMDGAADHAGYVIDVERSGESATMKLSNGFVSSFDRALVLADMYMSEDEHSPAAFMHLDRVTSDKGLGDTVRQDEWLDAHAQDYEFDVIDPESLDQ